MLERGRSILGVYYVADLMFDGAYPFSKLPRVWDGGRQKDESHLRVQEDHGLFPDHSSLFISHVVHLIKDDPCDFSGDFRTSVEHAP